MAFWTVLFNLQIITLIVCAIGRKHFTEHVGKENMVNKKKVHVDGKELWNNQV